MDWKETLDIMPDTSTGTYTNMKKLNFLLILERKGGHIKFFKTSETTNMRTVVIDLDFF